MKTNLLIMALAMAGSLVMATSCNNKNNKNKQKEQTEQKVETFMQVDDVLKDAEKLAGKEVAIEGVCTHICAHGGGKIFMMGSDDTKTIRVEAGKLGSFDKKCVNAVVKVNGILKEERIDEAYLQKWEESLKNETEEKHGHGEGGCDSSKKARGETANTSEDRIAAFRQKIADRQAKEGKAYLSFYFIEAVKYVYE